MALDVVVCVLNSAVLLRGDLSIYRVCFYVLLFERLFQPRSIWFNMNELCRKPNKRMVCGFSALFAEEAKRELSFSQKWHYMLF